MKLHVFGGIAVAGMALTSAIVWSATHASPPAVRELAKAPLPAEKSAQPAGAVSPEKPLLRDRSTFTAGETLMLEGRLGHAVLPSATESETYVFLDIKADAKKTASVDTPLQLAIVIDRSGSMRGKRLDNAIEAAKTAIARLRAGDTVSVLAYDTRVEVIVPTTVVDQRSRATIVRGLRGLRARGNTCISCAVEAGMRMLRQRPEAVSRLLLLSDGEATRGVKDLAGFNTIAERCRAMNISITSIGVDLDYNEQILAALDRRSNGRHYFAESSVRLSSIFDQEMQSLTKTIAADGHLHVSLAPGVVLDHVFDRSFQRTGAGISVPLGSFTAGDNKTVLLRVRVPRGRDGERAVAQVAMSYTDLTKGEKAHCDGALVAQATTDPAQVSPLDGLVAMRISRSETAEALEQANFLFRSGRGAEARDLLDSKRKRLERRKRASRKSAPRSRGWDVDQDFEKQSLALDAATGAFTKAEKAAAPGEAGQSAGGRAQIRHNQAAAVDLFE